MNEKCPPNLGTGAKTWRALVAVYQFRPDELQILEDACREIELIHQLDKALAKSTLLVMGSQGQEVINPLVQEIRQHRSIVKQLFASLKIPDASPGGAVAGDRASRNSDKARAVAHARWQRSS